MLWVEVLNRALDWSDLAGVRRELRGHAAAVVLDERTHARLLREVALVRRCFAADYLHVELPAADVRALSQWVAAVTLRSGAASGADVVLPEVRGRRTRDALPDPFETLLTTALIEMKMQQPGAAATVVHRCHGVLRGGAPAVADVPDWSQRFAQIAGIDAIVRDGVFHQCPRLIVSARGSRYCSKSCSNASFVARKAQSEPRYFARKQERYRRRRDGTRKSIESDRGAFVYMD
ncbi:MAG: hypothetical protein JSW67_11455 [Candidatus Latescibacterota bacterium]|nr:MAG: hypothetical protein JSW67_11455 [Candidatus Latescibacterota bacterium]